MIVENKDQNTIHKLIYDNLMDTPGNKKTSDSSIFVCCPFHDENTPSCSVNVSMDSDIPLGSFYCFGCGEKGGWNKIAAKLGFPQIEKWKFFDETARHVSSLVNTHVEADLLGNFQGKKNKEKTSLMEKLNSKQAIPWPRNKDWRGYSGSIISNIGGMFFNDVRKDEMMLAFPISINNRIRGGLKAKLEKSSKKEIAYLTTEGKWVNKYGIFPFDYTKKLIRKYRLKYVVVVEGPRDALRLLCLGIPAVAILGANTVTEKKMDLIMTLMLGAEVIYCMSDSDRAGGLMWAKIKSLTSNRVECERIKLPKIKKDGKPVKVDPDSCPDWYMDRIVKYLNKKHPKQRAR